MRHHNLNTRRHIGAHLVHVMLTGVGLHQGQSGLLMTLLIQADGLSELGQLEGALPANIIHVDGERRLIDRNAVEHAQQRRQLGDRLAVWGQVFIVPGQQIATLRALRLMERERHVLQAPHPSRQGGLVDHRLPHEVGLLGEQYGRHDEREQ